MYLIVCYVVRVTIPEAPLSVPLPLGAAVPADHVDTPGVGSHVPWVPIGQAESADNPVEINVGKDGLLVLLVKGAMVPV